MLQPSELVDQAFLRFFRASHALAATTLQQEAALYAELLGYGWSLEDLVIAAKTGYNYAAHAAPIRRRYGRYAWKPCTNAEALTAWLRHYYRQTKAAQASMSFDEFIEQWCKLADHNAFDDQRSSLTLVQCYVKARRTGLPDEEAWWLTLFCYQYHHLYIELRRKGIDRELTRRLIGVYRRQCAIKYLSFSTKYVVEAHRRGATGEQLEESVRYNTSQLLALNLRRATHTSA